MACDEALLLDAQHSRQATLRVYQWLRPTLSLGYFQASRDRQQHAASRDADIVRRLSGGGAIVHDRELTYSLVLPATHPLAAETQTLYDAVHTELVDWLQTELLADTPTWQAVLCQPASKLLDQVEPFLCFQRRSPGDVLLQNTSLPTPTAAHKVIGSAQRRKAGAVLQHGSILLGRSRFAPELPGIAEICGQDIAVETLLHTLLPALAQALQLDLQPTTPSQRLLSQTNQLLQAKYGNSQWLAKR